MDGNPGGIFDSSLCEDSLKGVQVGAVIKGVGVRRANKNAQSHATKLRFSNGPYLIDPFINVCIILELRVLANLDVHLVDHRWVNSRLRQTRQIFLL